MGLWRIVICFVWLVAAQATFASAASPAAEIRSILSAPDSTLSYERAKLALDRIMAPETNETAVKAKLDRLAADAKQIAGNGTDIDKLKAVRQVIYEAGPSNDGRPFSYDHDDPYGEDLRNKLLATYLDTRRGNCVSMPILQLIVAERLGLNVSLSTAPNHVFMRYTNPTNGRSFAIESTGGGHPARETEYYEKMGVTDAQVQSGIYLGVLTKRESIAVMASTVVEWLLREGRYTEAAAVTDVLLEHYSKDVHALLFRGAALSQILRTEYVERYPIPAAIPPPLRPRFHELADIMNQSYRQAKAWGWKPPAQ